MTEEQAIELIGKRAEELSKEDSIKQQCNEMLENGMRTEDVKGFVWNLAMSTLFGKGDYNAND